MRNKIKSKLQISKSSWSPQKSHDEYVNYYSIPNFDLGFPKEEKTSEIKSGKFLINQPCILISKLNPGTPRVWLIQDLLAGVNVCSTEFVVLIPNEKLDLKYIYFLLKSNTVTIRLTDMSTGTSNSHQRVLPESILELEVDWNENANERYVLSEFLWGLEQKISTNNALSKTLEDIAQTIFKSWFIDFDPVKAKMNGEKPIGMDDETAALFPDSFEESELGLIPKGWNAGMLNSLLHFQKSTAKPGLDTESAPYVPVDQIGAKDIFLRKSESGSEAKTSLVSFKKHDILFGAMRPYFHKVTLAPFDGTTRTTTFVLRPFNPKYLAYALLTVFQDKAVAFATNNSQGTTIPYAVWNESFEYYPIVIPSTAIATEFNNLVTPLFDFGYSLIAENQNLIRIRDSLLPRLISGELQISEEMLAS